MFSFRGWVVFGLVLAVLSACGDDGKKKKPTATDADTSSDASGTDTSQDDVGGDAAADTAQGDANESDTVEDTSTADTGSGDTDLADTGVANLPPSEPEVALGTVVTGEQLQARILTDATDPDGDRVTYLYRWTLNDADLLSVTGEAVPASLVRRGDRWQVFITATDGTSSAAEVSASTIVGNAAPVAGAVTLSSDGDGSVTDLFEASMLATDAESDLLVVTWRWYRNGIAVEGEEGAVLRGGLLARGDLVTALATVSDGSATVESPLSSELLVENAAPDSAPVVRIAGGSAGAVSGDELRAELVTASSDPDGDSLRYTRRWFLNGIAQPELVNSSSVSGALVRRGDVWRLEITPDDGLSDGPIGTDETVIGNASPRLISAVLSPSVPTVDDVLNLVWEASDAESDLLAVGVAWTVDGEVVLDGSGTELAAPAFGRGSVVGATVTVSDGQGGQAALSVPTVVVSNRAPSAPVVVIQPAATGDAVVASILSPAIDPDGDAVTYRAAWLRNGAAVGGVEGLSIAAGTAFRGEIWTVEVRAADGSIEGAAATATVQIGNAAPVLDALRFLESEPTTLTGISAEAIFTDAESDPVEVSFLWKVNGLSAASAGNSLSAGSVRKGDLVEVTVVADDGDDRSTPESRTTAIGNAAPSAPAVAIAVPGRSLPVFEGDPLRCEIAAVGVDPDGDLVTHTFAWSSDGNLVGEGSGSGDAREIAGSSNNGEKVTFAGDRWRCTARATDGTAQSAEAFDEVVPNPYLYRPELLATLYRLPSGLTGPTDGGSPNFLHRIDPTTGAMTAITQALPLEPLPSGAETAGTSTAFPGHRIPASFGESDGVTLTVRSNRVLDAASGAFVRSVGQQTTFWEYLPWLDSPSSVALSQNTSVNSGDAFFLLRGTGWAAGSFRGDNLAGAAPEWNNGVTTDPYNFWLIGTDGETFLPLTGYTQSGLEGAGIVGNASGQSTAERLRVVVPLTTHADGSYFTIDNPIPVPYVTSSQTNTATQSRNVWMFERAADGTVSRRQVTCFGTGATNRAITVQVSPDGNRALLQMQPPNSALPLPPVWPSAASNTQVRLFEVDLDGAGEICARVVELPALPADAVPATYSVERATYGANGRYITAIVTPKGTSVEKAWNLWLYDREAGVWSKLTGFSSATALPPHFIWSASLSPDGSWLSFTTNVSPVYGSGTAPLVDSNANHPNIWIIEAPLAAAAAGVIPVARRLTTETSSTANENGFQNYWTLWPYREVALP